MHHDALMYSLLMHVAYDSQTHWQVLLEEFGKWINSSAINSTVADRNLFYQLHLEAARPYIANGSALKVWP